jgi:hypothetical protein
MFLSILQCFYIFFYFTLYLFRSPFIYIGFYSFIVLSKFSYSPYFCLSFYIRYFLFNRLPSSTRYMYITAEGQTFWSSKHGSLIRIECTIFDQRLPPRPLYEPPKSGTKGQDSHSWPTTTRFSKFKHPEVRWSLVSLCCSHNRLSLSVSSFKIFF